MGETDELLDELVAEGTIPPDVNPPIRDELKASLEAFKFALGAGIDFDHLSMGSVAEILGKSPADAGGLDKDH